MLACCYTFFFLLSGYSCSSGGFLYFEYKLSALRTNASRELDSPEGCRRGTDLVRSCATTLPEDLIFAPCIEMVYLSVVTDREFISSNMTFGTYPRVSKG